MYNDIVLTNALYYNNNPSFSFTDNLELIDPTDNYKNQSKLIAELDAFERQLKRYDIRVSGGTSNKVKDFFRDDKAAILFPEFINRLIKRAYGLKTDIYDMTNEELAQLMSGKKENKDMDINTEKENLNKELEETNKELERILAHKKDIENKIRTIEKAERKKYIEERDKEVTAIINAIKAFNEKYGMENAKNEEQR